ncbi:uncharacterized protein K452DRAFT_360496 [Aplosporella prunicola CBS 121167]|uniref:Uncharacterized protein n=1 Tax=Aplosporella prunicola CBS 121167 TaxID=1176127 RepID=A0A6A6B5B5_9PEZI|nr:uncharacterized protein K452DRAFT_360496 [Aplosporella prunicola CBS 121167]KAF2139230.1 hypothetical protein K452DRAFT_360496 [Aplosporella prunicola CBS 121167]
MEMGDTTWTEEKVDMDSSFEDIAPVAAEGASEYGPTTPDCGFIENQLHLCRLQDDLEMILYIFCRVVAPDIIQKRRWDCYKAAELTRIAGDVIRYCKRNTQFLSHTGISYLERDFFVQDLRECRDVQNFALHRLRVPGDRLRTLLDCGTRVMVTVQHMLGSRYEIEMDNMHKWLASQNWDVHDPRDLPASVLKGDAQMTAKESEQKLFAGKEFGGETAFGGKEFSGKKPFDGKGISGERPFGGKGIGGERLFGGGGAFARKGFGEKTFIRNERVA